MPSGANRAVIGQAGAWSCPSRDRPGGTLCSTTAGWWPSPREPSTPRTGGATTSAGPCPEYVDGNECLFCHRNDVGPTWSDNHHNRSVRELAPDSPALAALAASPGLKQAAGEVSLVMGESHRQRFLKPAAASVSSTCFRSRGCPPRAAAARANSSRPISPTGTRRRSAIPARAVIPPASIRPAAHLLDAFARLRRLPRRGAERPHEERRPSFTSRPGARTPPG